MLSLSDLPRDDSGLIPAGEWLAILRDEISDSFAGMRFVLGVMQDPIKGNQLVRLVATMAVLGALRVSGGEPMALGDTSKLGRQPVWLDGLKPSLPAQAPAPVPLQVQAPAPMQAPAKQTAAVTRPPQEVAARPQEGAAAAQVTPTSLAEVEALGEPEARAMAADLGCSDKRWSVQKVRTFIADELGL